MLILGLDLETTGLDIENDRIVELGAVLWDTTCNSPMRMISCLINDYTAPESCPEAFATHGITKAMCEEHGIPAGAAFSELEYYIARSEYLIGHNIRGFDEKMLRQSFMRLGMNWEHKPLIDTMTDLPFLPKIKGRTLVGLGAEHGFLNPFPHRAVTDVLSCLKLFSCYPLNEVLHLANSPLMTIAADVPYQRKDDAKKLGYKWDGDRKIWHKLIRDFQLEDEKAKANFHINVLTIPMESKGE